MILEFIKPVSLYTNNVKVLKYAMLFFTPSCHDQALSFGAGSKDSSPEVRDRYPEMTERGAI